MGHGDVFLCNGEIKVTEKWPWPWQYVSMVLEKWPWHYVSMVMEKRSWQYVSIVIENWPWHYVSIMFLWLQRNGLDKLFLRLHRSDLEIVSSRRAYLDNVFPWLQRNDPDFEEMRILVTSTGFAYYHILCRKMDLDEKLTTSGKYAEWNLTITI